MKTLGMTGATGFIGSYLSQKFCTDFNLRKLLRSPSNATHRDVVGNMNDAQTLKKFVSGLDTVLHLANANFPRDTNNVLSQDLSENLLHTVQLFELFAKENPNGHLIFFSSGGAVYDPYLPKTPRQEFDKTSPISNYGVQKLAAEQFLAVICHQTGLRATVLRVSNPYGTLLSPERPQGIIGVAMTRIKLDLPLNIFGSLHTVRDYVHLSDVAEATRRAIELPPEKGKIRIFNVGLGKGTSIQVLLDYLEQVTGKKINKIISTSQVPEPEWNVLDVTKINLELGWKPEIDLLPGLQMAYKATFL